MRKEAPPAIGSGKEILQRKEREKKRNEQKGNEKELHGVSTKRRKQEDKQDKEKKRKKGRKSLR